MNGRWRQLELPWRAPWLVVQVLVREFGREGLVWLDGSGSALAGISRIGVAPREQLVCRGLPGEVDAQDPFAALAEIAASNGHWMGWLAYEAGAWVEPASHWQPPTMATLWAAQHDPVLAIDTNAQQLWLEGRDAAAMEAMAAVIRAVPDGASAESEATSGSRTDQRLPVEQWHWHTDPTRFATQVQQIRELIACGDLFQANLTACVEQQLAAPPDALALYGRLRQQCPAPFAGLAIAGGSAAGEAVLSASPERFLRLDAEGWVETRPIKGTRPRHRDPEADAEAAAELITSPKDRAENVMVVDLLRNDLGRVCEPGSVSVPQLVGLESYAQVHHLTSVVRGKLRADVELANLLRASWPGGSISGAPKVRACQRLAELEPVPRGPYCGSLFRVAPDGSFDSSILIRSAFIKGRTIRAHAGCGIVADSDPQGEAEELGWKLQPLLEALA
ncbi:MAG: anthranilate synthase component I family protein [Cyanobacteriota bacterium]|nr:anthranilate synthase component I family protein [Cyanobacteriota bacterium]